MLKFGMKNSKKLSRKVQLTLSKISSKAAVLVAIFCVGTLAARGDPVSVPNSSFETPSKPEETSSNPTILPGWVFSVGTRYSYGTQAISTFFTSKGAADGSNYAFMDNSGSSFDTLDSSASLGTITGDTTYTLTVAIGNPKSNDPISNGSPGNISFSLLADGVAFATDTVPNGTVANGTFQDFTLTYTTPDSGSMVGDDLKIQLASLPTSGDSTQASFDDVTLDATAMPLSVPEPSTWLLLAGAMLALAWRLRFNTLK
jgi:hypothetical protein